jgi:hypothetical protein
MTITKYLDHAFAGNEGALRTLRLILSSKDDTTPVQEISDKHILPIIDKISAQCGGDMDPCYIGYMIQYSLINPNHEMPENPAKHVVAPPINLGDLKAEEEFDAFVVANLPAILPRLISTAEAAGLTFSKKITVTTEGFATPVPCPDMCANDKNEIVREFVEAWLGELFEMLTALFANAKKEAANGPCDKFSEDPCITDMSGEPKGQCECGYKEAFHSNAGVGGLGGILR